MQQWLTSSVTAKSYIKTNIFKCEISCLINVIGDPVFLINFRMFPFVSPKYYTHFWNIYYIK